MLVHVKVNRGNKTPVETSEGLEIYTTARREKNMANLDVMRQIADYYHIDTARIRLIRGRTSRKKIFNIEL